MASIFWIGGTAAVAQVDVFTPTGTVTTGDVNTLTVKDEFGATIATVTFTVGGTATAAAVVTGLTTAWNANPITFAIATPSGTGTLILTSKNSGVPQYITSAVTGVATLVKTTPTASGGPNDLNVASNWSSGTVPVGSDDVSAGGPGGSANDMLYGLNQSAVTWASFTILPDAPDIGQAIIPLSVGITTLNVPAVGTNQTAITRLNLNLGTVQTNASIQQTGTTPTDPGREPVRITGAHASNVITIAGNSIVGIGTNKPSDAPQFPTINVGGTGSPIVTLGSKLVAGVTGTLISGTINANNRPGGNIFASLVLAGIPGGNVPLIDFSGNISAFTVAALTLGQGKIKVASAAQATWTAITLPFGSTRTLSVTYA